MCPLLEGHLGHALSSLGVTLSWADLYFAFQSIQVPLFFKNSVLLTNNSRWSLYVIAVQVVPGARGARQQSVRRSAGRSPKKRQEAGGLPRARRSCIPSACLQGRRSALTGDRVCPHLEFGLPGPQN